ncbi:cytochrome b-c1 complex subunit 9 isoform X6 [Ceratina calcarata]|uniref:Cytochrome b-c1 complex subunit 9 n=1 Tax=Ceratina calcarata TaxID=156304 RepID=A0AAJ7S531_9HYME|nr:cytochrome b-c1 complex subunit 9 isoform X6 [Ceratina calcarata]
MISRLIYRYIFKRTSSFVLSIVIASMFFERAYDHACENIFEWINEGRLWKDIKHKYENPPQTLTYQDNSVEKGTIEGSQESSEDTKEG